MKQPRLAFATGLAAVLAWATLYSGPLNPAPWTWRGLGTTLVAATDVVTRGPYLQMGTASSVVVRWRTNNPTDSQVAYGLDPTSLFWTTSLAPLTTEHEVVVSGLLPQTKYYYAVGTTTQLLAGGDSNHSLVTSPLIGTAVPTRIWVLGDSGTADANVAAVRDAYYSFGGATPTNLWLMLGDNAYNGGLDTEYQAAVFDMFPQTLRQSVLWPTVGNHDIANSAAGTGPYYSIFTLPKSAEAGGLASGTEAYYSFDYGNIHFICLDSFDVDLSAGAPMMTWLQNDLASTASRWIIAFWHHPPYSKGSHDSDVDFELTQMRQNALPLLEAAGVDLVLAGHSHSYERSFLIDGHYGRSTTFSAAMKKDSGNGREDGTGAYTKPTTIPAPHAGAVYTVAGSSGFAGGGALNHPAMFVSLNVMGSLVLDVNNGRLDAQFIDNTSAVRDHFTILKDVATPLALTTSSIPGGVVGTAYSQILAATGGVTPYAWTLSTGNLPSGLSLNAATGAVSGTPTTAGTAVFTVQVRDNSAPQLIAERQFSIAIASALIAVPDVQLLTQTAASAALTDVGLTPGTVSTAPSSTVPSGSVISQTPLAGSQVTAGSRVDLVVSTGIAAATAPTVIGSQIAGTFADATGHSAQSHLVYAANAGVWWLFTLTSTADSVGGTNHSVKAYRSSGSNLATATWTAAAASPGALSSASVNCSSCSMSDGRALSVAYVNNAPTDVVHLEVALAADGQNGLTAHIRATLTAASIGWDGWNYYDAPAATWTRPRGTALGVSTGKFIHSGGPILQQEVDANTRMSRNPDVSGTWTSGFSSVSVIDNSMIHQSNALAFAPLANNTMLAVYDNGGGVSTCYNCGQVGVPEPNLTNLGFKKSNPDGSWPPVVVASQGGGDGKVFSTEATIDQNDWALVARSTTAIYAFRSNADASGIDAAAYSAATNTWAPFTPPPLVGSGQSLKKGAGVFGAAIGSNIWLFVVNTDAANSILYTAFNGTTWTQWATVPGTGTGQHVRKFISGYQLPVSNQIALIWTEGTIQNDVIVTALAADFTPIVPNVVNMVQAAAALEITNAGLKQGNVVTLSNPTVPIGSVISQSPLAGSPVLAQSAVDLVVSSGVTVPAVVGQTRSDATALITAVAGLAVGAVTTVSSATVPAGTVVSQNPAGNTNVSGGSSVALVVSAGLVMVSVPNVVNLTQSAAASAIIGASLVIGTVTNATSATVPTGSVISQTPVAALQVAPGSAVNLVVSSGPVVAAPTVDIVVFSDGSGTRTTSAFSTAVSGEILLAFVGADGPAASPQTVTVSGAGLSWTLVRRANVQAGTSEIWQAKAAAKLTSVTVRSTLSVAGYRQSLTVVAFRGATGIGASAIANGLSGAPNVSLATTRANALVYGVGNDWDRAVARTLGAGQVMVHQRIETAAGDTFWVQRRSAAVANPGSSVQLNDTAPTNDRWNFASIEIVP